MLEAVLRSDFIAFVEKVFQTVSGADDYAENWHIEAMAHALELVRIGVNNRLGIFLPPRHLKSIVVSVAYPAWVLAQEPSCRIMVVSHSLDLAVTLQRQFRQVVESDWYLRLFPHMSRQARKDTETELVTYAGGGRLAVSVGGSITGRGAEIIIVDDPMKAEMANSAAEESKVRTWFDQTLSTRLNNKKSGAMILVMQRLSVGDLAAHAVNDSWVTLQLPAIAQKIEAIPLYGGGMARRRPGELLHPERESEAEYDQLRAQLGTAGFNAQYLQAPIPAGGGMLRLEWFRRYRALPDRRTWTRILHSWDTAVEDNDSADYSVWQKWVVAPGGIYLVDQLRHRMLFPELRQTALELIAEDQPDHILIERAASGRFLAQEVWVTLPLRERPKRVPRIVPVRDKISRAAQVSALIERGEVFLPEQGDFLPELEAEIQAFPKARHDDQIDAMTQALGFWQNDIMRQQKARVFLIHGARREHL